MVESKLLSNCCKRLQLMQQYLNGNFKLQVENALTKERLSGQAPRACCFFFKACQSACSDYVILVVYKCIQAEYWLCPLYPNRWLFTSFCRQFAYVSKYALSQAPSDPNYALPGSALNSRTGVQGSLHVQRDWKVCDRWVEKYGTRPILLLPL